MSIWPTLKRNHDSEAKNIGARWAAKLSAQPVGLDFSFCMVLLTAAWPDGLLLGPRVLCLALAG